MRNRAISLVEILVVITILAVLAALVFAVYRPARAAAKRTSRVQQMRQLYQACQLYAIDHDDEARYSEIQGLTYIPFGIHPLDPYIKSREVWLCPSCPPWIREQKIANTYSLMLWGTGSLESTVSGNGFTIPSRRKKMIGLYEKLGSGTPIVVCGIHDEFEPHPEQPASLGTQERPYFYWIGLDGGLRHGFAEWAEMTNVWEMLKNFK